MQPCHGFQLLCIAIFYSSEAAFYAPHFKNVSAFLPHSAYVRSTFLSARLRSAGGDNLYFHPTILPLYFPPNKKEPSSINAIRGKEGETGCHQKNFAAIEVNFELLIETERSVIYNKYGGSLHNICNFSTP